MTRVAFKRLETFDGSSKPGHWAPNGKRNLAWICCPQCGQWNMIGRDDPRRSNHPIEPNGDVNPSVICVADGCTYHEFIRLDGWPS